MSIDKDELANLGMSDNLPDHASDDGPESPPDSPEETSLASRGSGPPSNRPSLDDALIQGGGAGFSPIIAMLRASEHPLDWLVRHRLDERSVYLMILGNSLLHGAMTGRVNPGLDNYMRLTMSQGINGAALKDAKEMYMGRMERARDDRREGILTRAQTLNQEQIEQNTSGRQ